MLSFGHTRAQQLDKSEVEVEHQATMLGVEGLQLNAGGINLGHPGFQLLDWVRPSWDIPIQRASNILAPSKTLAITRHMQCFRLWSIEDSDDFQKSSNGKNKRSSQFKTVENSTKVWVSSIYFNREEGISLPIDHM